MPRGVYYSITLLWVFIMKSLFLESIVWWAVTNFLTVFYSGSTYFLNASISSDRRNISLFYFIFLLLYYRTYGFVASHPRENPSSRFPLHTIWVFHLYIFTLSWMVAIIHDHMWHLLVYFLMTYFNRDISCLNILQIFSLLVEQCVRIYVIFFRRLPLMSHSSV